MNHSEIRAGNEADIRAWIKDQELVDATSLHMLAMAFDDFEHGLDVVYGIAEELGVKVEGEAL